jgi:hypothetical protein
MKYRKTLTAAAFVVNAGLVTAMFKLITKFGFEAEPYILGMLVPTAMLFAWVVMSCITIYQNRQAEKRLMDVFFGNHGIPMLAHFPNGESVSNK